MLKKINAITNQFPLYEKKNKVWRQFLLAEHTEVYKKNCLLVIAKSKSLAFI